MLCYCCKGEDCVSVELRPPFHTVVWAVVMAWLLKYVSKLVIWVIMICGLIGTYQHLRHNASMFKAVRHARKASLATMHGSMSQSNVHYYPT